jgi:hypothetical protein
LLKCLVLVSSKNRFVRRRLFCKIFIPFNSISLSRLFWYSEILVQFYFMSTNVWKVTLCTWVKVIWTRLPKKRSRIELITLFEGREVNDLRVFILFFSESFHFYFCFSYRGYKTYSRNNFKLKSNIFFFFPLEFSRFILDLC